VVPPNLRLGLYPAVAGLTKIPCVMHTGERSQRHFFGYDLFRFIPSLCNGSSRIELLVFSLQVSIRRENTAYSTFRSRCLLAQLGGPFGSCAFAWLTPLWSRYFRTRPAARLSGNRFGTYSSTSTFLVFDWRELYAVDGICQDILPFAGRFTARRDEISLSGMPIASSCG
jgi:hypothetical protein